MTNHIDCHTKITTVGNASVASVKLSNELSLYMRTIIDIAIFKTNYSLNINNISSESSMKLDSHANMPVVGQHAYVLSESISDSEKF